MPPFRYQRWRLSVCTPPVLPQRPGCVCTVKYTSPPSSASPVIARTPCNCSPQADDAPGAREVDGRHGLGPIRHTRRELDAADLHDGTRGRHVRPRAVEDAQGARSRHQPGDLEASVGSDEERRALAPRQCVAEGPWTAVLDLDQDLARGHPRVKDRRTRQSRAARQHEAGALHAPRDRRGRERLPAPFPRLQTEAAGLVRPPPQFEAPVGGAPHRQARRRDPTLDVTRPATGKGQLARTDEHVGAPPRRHPRRPR